MKIAQICDFWGESNLSVIEMDARIRGWLGRDKERPAVYTSRWRRALATASDLECTCSFS